MPTITGDELIAEIVGNYPKVAPLITRYGLHCVGCHVNEYETLRDGVKVHGMPDETFDKMIVEINALLNKKIDTIALTEMATFMIKHYAEQDGKQGQGLKIVVSMTDDGSFGYEMEFTDGPSDGDEVFTFGKEGEVQLFVDKVSYTKLKGSEIDFIETGDDAGFKIENPNKKKKTD